MCGAIGHIAFFGYFDGLLEHLSFDNCAAFIAEPIMGVGSEFSMGLMLAVDLVEGKTSKTPFPLSAGVADIVFRKCLDALLIVRLVGDRISLSPPLIINDQETQSVFDILADAVASI